MSKIVEFPQREDTYDQASLWIAKIDRGLSREETLALQDWLSLSSEHRSVLFEMAELWDKMDSLTRLAELFDAPDTGKSTQGGKMRMAIAACFVVAACAFAWNFSAFKSPGFNAFLAGFKHYELFENTYETTIGEHSTVNLPDGSVLVLNTNSQVKVQYTPEARLFFLEQGELNIEVAHDKSRPLSVMARDKLVQAVGTAFNVRIQDDNQVELLVTDGRVRVAHHQEDVMNAKQQPQRLPENSLAVSKGEKIVLGAKKENIAKVDDTEIAAELSWREGNLVFRGETLEQALHEISRYTAVKFEVADEDIKQKRIAGLFKAGDVDGLLAALEQNFNIHAKRVSANKIRLQAENR